MWSRLFLVAFAVCPVIAFQSSASANLVVQFSAAGPDVSISVSGSGTVPNGSGTPGSELEFFNFDGNPFSGLIDQTFNLTGSLTVTGTESSGQGGPYTSTINSIRLVNQGVGASDLHLFGDFSIGQQDTYTFSGTAVVQGLTLADLTAGNYVPAGGGSEDSDAFGPVSMVIVPEPASLAMMGLAAMGLCVSRVRRRRRSSLSTSDAASSDGRGLSV